MMLILSGVPALSTFVRSEEQLANLLDHVHFDNLSTVDFLERLSFFRIESLGAGNRTNHKNSFEVQRGGGDDMHD